MKIKTNKMDVNIPTWLVLAAVLVADNVYANHCKKKAITEYLMNCDLSKVESSGDES